MEKLYEDWLIEQIHADSKPDGYSELCRILHRIQFMPMVMMDWNRNDDALNLVWEWAESLGDNEDETMNTVIDLEGEHPNGFCTMLELLVVLSRMLDYELKDSEYDYGTGYWAELLIRNIGLEEYVNHNVEEDYDRAEEAVIELVGTVILRQYGWDGEGGFFPLSHPASDQRDEELLIQMNNYIAENYDIC